MCVCTYTYRYVHTPMYVHKCIGVIPPLPLQSLKAAQKLSPPPPPPLFPPVSHQDEVQRFLWVCVYSQRIHEGKLSL